MINCSTPLPDSVSTFETVRAIDNQAMIKSQVISNTTMNNAQYCGSGFIQCHPPMGNGKLTLW